MTTLCRIDWVETRSDREARLARAQCGTVVSRAPDPAPLPAPDPPVAARPGAARARLPAPGAAPARR